MANVKMTLEEFWEKPLSKNNSDIEIEYKEHKFTAVIFPTEKCMWAHNGLISVPMSKAKTLEELKKMCDKYAMGKYACVRCGKTISPEDKPSYHSYFAGIYCNDCWTKEDQEELDWAYSHLD